VVGTIFHPGEFLRDCGKRSHHVGTRCTVSASRLGNHVQEGSGWVLVVDKNCCPVEMVSYLDKVSRKWFMRHTQFSSLGPLRKIFVRSEICLWTSRLIFQTLSLRRSSMFMQSFSTQTYALMRMVTEIYSSGMALKNCSAFRLLCPWNSRHLLYNCRTD
jgi:hypothetical protein